MKNIFRCGYTEIFIRSVIKFGSNFVRIEWVHKEEMGVEQELYTSICHISNIDLQSSLGHRIGGVRIDDIYEVNGIKVNKDGYLRILDLLSI